MKRIISIIIGILFYFIFAIFLFDFDNIKVLLIIIISSILLIIGITAIILWGMEYFAQFFISMNYTRLVLAILLPFFLIGIMIYFQKQKEIYNASQGKKIKSLVLHCDSLKCKYIKYGVFVHDSDTIKRIHSDLGDFEIIKKGYSIDTSLIKWENACTYEKISIHNKYKETVTIGNIENDSCIFYYDSFGKMMINEKGEIMKVKIIK